MWKFTKCPKCLREYFWFICPNRCEENKETKIDIPKVIKNVKEKKPDIKKEVIKKEDIDNNLDTIYWLPVYTSGYLNHTMKINLNSIKQEKICIKVWDKYILHDDIINKFKIDNWLVALESDN